MTPAEAAALRLEILASAGVEVVLRGRHGPTMVSIDQTIAMAWLLDAILPPVQDETPNPEDPKET